MTTKELVRRLLQYWVFIALLPLVTAASVYYFSRFQPKKYTSETTLYTGITSGYKIVGGATSSSRELEATLNAFDNLIALVNAREVHDEVCLRLLAWQLMQEAQRPAAQPAASYPGAWALRQLSRTLVKPLAAPYARLLTPGLRPRLLGATLAETLARLTTYYHSSTTNEAYQLLNSKDPLFSKEALARIVVNRLQNSDMLQISYTATSPLICQKTLELLTEVVIRKNRELFAGQGEAVTDYFAQATHQAQARLQAAEQRRFAFEQQHNIVDYERQISLLTGERQMTANAYSALEMQYAGAVAARQTLETMLARWGIHNLQSQTIIDLRNQLASLNTQANEAALLLKSQPDAAVAARLAGLRQQAAQLSTEIGAKVQAYAREATPGQGAKAKDLLADYTKTTLRVEDLGSRLALLRRQKDLAASRYSQLVPLGVEITQIRRELDVAEKAYASQAEGLKKSKLSQQNGALATQLRVIDPPYLPSTATDDKTLLLLLSSLVAVLLLTGAAVAITGLLDRSLLDPAQATRATSFAVAGVVPEPTATPDYALAQQAEDHMARQLLLQFHRQPKVGQPYVIGVLSSQRGEGKTSVVCNLVASLNEMGIRTLNLFPDDHCFQIIPNDDTLFYAPLQGLRPGTTVAELAGKQVHPEEVIIVEFPAVSESAYPVSILRELSLILVAVRAERTWQTADRTIFEHIRQATTAPIELVLNGVMPEYVVEIIGTRRRPASPSQVPALLSPLRSRFE